MGKHSCIDCFAHQITRKEVPGGGIAQDANVTENGHPLKICQVTKELSVSLGETPRSAKRGGAVATRRQALGSAPIYKCSLVRVEYPLISHDLAE